MKTETLCEYCGKYFTPKNNKQKFCSIDCKKASAYENVSFNHICSNCGKEYQSKSIHNPKYNNFCSKDCENIFKYNKYNETRKCEICNSDFECNKKLKQRFCSLNCQIRWQKENPKTGEQHQSYDKTKKRNFTCEWCNKDFKPKRLRDNIRFCSKECRQEWYSKVFSQTDEWRELKRIWGTNQMKNNKKSDSSAQILVNKILDKLKIRFENERSFKYFSVDNYLLDHDLIIEVMGTFWHCDIRVFDTIKYKNQKTRITMDKIKNTFLTGKCKIPVLYVWEYDLQNNIQLCEKLIELFISARGILNKYNSSDYFMKNNKIKEKDKGEEQYMYWDIDKLKAIIPPERKKKMSHVQKDKWITFNCENCGEAKDELLCHYSKSKNHFCSMTCYREYASKK